MVKYGFIGGGHMGMAIIQGLVLQKIVSTSQIGLYDHHPEKCKIAQEMGVTIFQNEKEVIQSSEVLVLAIKPQGLKQFVMENDVTNVKKLISLLAAVEIQQLQKYFQHAWIVRTMPNIPLFIQQGACAVSANSSCPKEFVDEVVEIFNQLGTACVVEEKDLDTMMVVNGSTPAYIAYFLKVLVDDAVCRGINESVAKALLYQTFIGEIELMKQDFDCDMNHFVDAVCSKGGTTIEAISYMKNNGLETILKNANQKCIDRANELKRML